MATAAESVQIAGRARLLYLEQLLKGLPGVVSRVSNAARELQDKPAEYAVAQARRDLVQGMIRGAGSWQAEMAAKLRHIMQDGGAQAMSVELPPFGRDERLSLVDNDVIEREILTSRLALAVMDRAGWEFSDLRSRVAMLERRGELDTHDLLRAHVLARVVLDAWRSAKLSADDWREAQPILHQEWASLVELAYREANRWLVSQRVMQAVDLRPNIRRTVQGPSTSSGGNGPASDEAESSAGTGTDAYAGSGTGPGTDAYAGSGTGTGFDQPTQYAPHPSTLGRGAPAPAFAPARTPAHAARPAATRAPVPNRAPAPSGAVPPPRSSRAGFDQVGEETRLMTRAAPLARGSAHAEAVLGRLNRLVGRHLPGFAETVHGRPVTEALSNAISHAQQHWRQRFAAPAGEQANDALAATGPMLIEELQQGKQALKQAAKSPEERATIEIVALMFQSILTEERIPAAMRVWFARLQMPVLRVAVSEPDFFATLDHPARRLIDRMGACVMGLDSASQKVGDSLDKEIKRVVQVVEAYPDTGRRVFQTVLTEFEKFLEHYFKNENEASKRGVSLAQQVEQRETLAIQYTIELRRMLNEVPVQEGVRQFLFQVWADVLATSAVRYGGQSSETKAMKRAAADLIWSASAKVTREERADVIRRLPPLLKRLREGMVSANMTSERQEERISALNSALAAAFTAKAAAIPMDRLQDLMERLESIEELLPGAEDIEIDESLVLDLSGHESSELEVVAEGGSLATAPMLAWARELQVGSWYTLEFRGRYEPVQLAWHGMRRQLSLFVTPAGRCVLFQLQRLGAFLQAGLLLPAQDEALTVKATRNAMARIDADPSQLMN